MNKTKIVIGSLVIGLISGILSIYLAPYAGIPFGVAVLYCLFLFFKDIKRSSRKFFFIIASGIACFVAVEMCMFLVEYINPIFFPALISSFFGSLILILSYYYILKIKLSRDWNIRLVILGVLLSSIMSVSFLTIYIFIFWQPIMLAAMMYLTAKAEEKNIGSEIKNSPILPK